MVGDVVGGYVVKEALASGRYGLLFLAIQGETGHRAVVQRRHGEDDLKSFAAEAAQALGVEPCLLVERRRSRAGVAVLLAIIDAEAPGLGYTEHTDTQQVLPRTGQRRPSLRRGRMLLGLGLLVLLGAGLGVLLSIASRSAPQSEALAPGPEVAKAMPVAPPPPFTGSPPLAARPIEPQAVEREAAVDARPRQLHGWVLAAETQAASSPKKQSSRVKVTIEAEPPCAFDDRFRDYARRTRADLRTMGNPRAPKFMRADDQLSHAMVEGDCRRVNAVLNELRRLVGAPIE